VSSELLQFLAGVGQSKRQVKVPLSTGMYLSLWWWVHDLQEEGQEQDDTTWNKSIAAGTCLGLAARVVQNDIVPMVGGWVGAAMDIQQQHQRNILHLISGQGCWWLGEARCTATPQAGL
jgi:hypothetical protein